MGARKKSKKANKKRATAPVSSSKPKKRSTKARAIVRQKVLAKKAATAKVRRRSAHDHKAPRKRSTERMARQATREPKRATVPIKPRKAKPVKVKPRKAKPAKAKPVKVKPRKPKTPKPASKKRHPRRDLQGPRPPQKKGAAWTWGVEREPKPLPEKKVFRDKRGRTLSRDEARKARKVYEAEREFAKKVHEAKLERARLNPISDDTRRELQSMMKHLALSAEEPNTDFVTETAADFQGHAMYAKLVVGGITSVKVDEDLAADQVSQIVEAVIARLRKQKIKRGLSVQFSFVPEEAVYLAYGRDGDLMTTAWAFVNKPDDVEAFAPAARRMAAAMLRNGWDITAMNVMLFYDNVSAKGELATQPARKRRR